MQHNGFSKVLDDFCSNVAAQAVKMAPSITGFGFSVSVLLLLREQMHQQQTAMQQQRQHQHSGQQQSCPMVLAETQSAQWMA